MLRTQTLVVGALAVAMACARQPARGALEEGNVALRTHAPSYGVRSDSCLFKVDIKYTYTNHSNTPVSVTTCRGPTPPTLEKRVAGDWVTAFSPIVLLC